LKQLADAVKSSADEIETKENFQKLQTAGFANRAPPPGLKEEATRVSQSNQSATD